MENETKNKLITEGSALSIPEMIKHHNALIKLYKDLSKIERDRKNLNAPKISFNKTAREVCNTASIRINAYDDFILHLQGCITLMRDGGN
jgi:hypothetical protein